MSDKITYAKYTISKSGPDKGKVLKDGHTMFTQDIVADLNRKSYLEEKLQKAKDVLNKYSLWRQS